MIGTVAVKEHLNKILVFEWKKDSESRTLFLGLGDHHAKSSMPSILATAAFRSSPSGSKKRSGISL